MTGDDLDTVWRASFRPSNEAGSGSRRALVDTVGQERMIPSKA
jgi:hypothetical protein